MPEEELEHCENIGTENKIDRSVDGGHETLALNWAASVD